MEKVEIKEKIRKMIEFMDNEKIRSEIGNHLHHIALVAEKEDFKMLLDKYVSYPEHTEIIQKEWKRIYANSDNSAGLLEIFSRDEATRKEILSSVNFLINYGTTENTADLCKELDKIEDGNKVIAENFEELWNLCICNEQNIVIPMLKTELGRTKIKTNFDDIKTRFFPDNKFSKPNLKGFFQFINKLEGIEIFEKEFNKYKFWEELYNQIDIPVTVIKRVSQIWEMTQEQQALAVENNDAARIKDFYFKKILLSDDIDEKRMILQEVANGNEYKYKGRGMSSFVIQAGNQVVKLGAGRVKYELPYHPRIMMPYFRKKYSDGSCLEVFNMGECDQANITDEQLLEIYKELESAGIRWTDARKDNLVVLKEDNVLPDFIKSKDFNIFGFLDDERFPTNNHKPLKKGDIVISDLDFLYAMDDPDYEVGVLDDVIKEYIKDKYMKKFSEDEIEY